MVPHQFGTDKHGVIGGQVGNFGGNLRPGVIPLLLFGLLHHGIIVAGVGRNSVELNEIASHSCVDLFSDLARIAGMRKIKDQHTLPFGFRRQSGRKV